MEPVTINLPDFSALAEQFGPFGYLLGHIVAALIFGAFAFRQISLAGKCHSEGCSDMNNAKTREEKARSAVGDSHIWRGAITGVIGFVNVIMVILLSGQLFDAALNKVNPRIASTDSTDSTSETLSTGFAWKPSLTFLESYSGPHADELKRLMAGGIEADAAKAASEAVKSQEIVQASPLTLPAAPLNPKPTFGGSSAGSKGIK